MTRKNIYAFCVAMMTAAPAALAQGLNTDISVTHDIVPEEQAPTRLHILPKVNLPQITRGRLAPASNLGAATITPFINMLQPAEYLTSSTRTPRRGYAALGYGPAYNLAASAGYRFVEKERLTVDGYFQFDGMSYKSYFPKFEYLYPAKVNLHRNTGLIGGNTRWTPVGNHGTLTASLFYQYSGYNFPILDLPTAAVNASDISANVMKIDAAWAGHSRKVDYSLAAGYNMIRFAPNRGNYGGNIDGRLLWHASSKSAWGLDLGFKMNTTSFSDEHINVFHSKLHYNFTTTNFKATIGLLFDVSSTEIYSNSVAGWVLPELKLQWLPSGYFNVWAQFTGRIDDNNRLAIYNEQPYLMTDFEAGTSKILSIDFGVTLGPWRGASITAFGGVLGAFDWYMPAYKTGYMMPMDVSGWHGGITFDYSYRQYLSMAVKAEFAQSPTDNFERGYAYWRDHAGFNLIAKAASRPISPLEISLAYHLRTHRSKITPSGHLDLLSISNLSASARYEFTPQWGAFINGENLLNRHWYLGPSVPSQGIMVMVGADYKF